jgi:integration host factor subunit beta
MTKSDLIDLLCEAEKMPKGRAELLINSIFDCMEASLRRGERIEIRGFGSFEIRHYRAYEGRNPRTGSAVPVRPKRLPFFKVGKELKERVNLAAARDAANRAVAGASASPGAGQGNGQGQAQAAGQGAAQVQAPAQAPAPVPAQASADASPSEGSSTSGAAALHRPPPTLHLPLPLGGRGSG